MLSRVTLNDVGQFVGEEGAARVRGGGILAGGKGDVRAGRVGVGIDGASGFGGVRGGVDAAVARYGGTRLVLLGGIGDAFHEGNSRSERNDAAACAFTMARAADCNTREIRSATAACLVFAIRARCRG